MKLGLLIAFLLSLSCTSSQKTNTTSAERDLSSPYLGCQNLKQLAGLSRKTRCEMGKEWENYGNTVINRPQIYIEPQTEFEVQKIVAEAFKWGWKVRPVGSGHSWSRITESDDILMGTHQLLLRNDSGRTAVFIDRANQTARIGAGMRLRKIIDTIEANGFTLSNLGDAQSQTIAGAISTNTHGSGITHTGFAGMVKSFNLVDGQGRLHRNVTARNNPDLFRSALSGLGMLGVITEVTIKIVPKFNILTTHTHLGLSTLFETGKYEELLEKEWFSFLWVINSGHVAIFHGEKANIPGRTPKTDNDFQDYLGRNLFVPLAQGVYVNARRPLQNLIPRIYRNIRGGDGDQTKVQTSYENSSDALSKRIAPVHWPWNLETEFFIPASYVPAFISAMADYLDRAVDTKGRPYVPAAPIFGFRYVKSDNTFLSPTYSYKGHDKWVAISVFDNLPKHIKEKRTTYLQNIRNILQNVVGPDRHLLRMHMGKVYLDEPEEFRCRIWNFQRFAETRAEHDPKGIFLNPWTTRFFQGPCPHGS